MYAARFDYHRPKDLQEAIAILQKTADAKILAGGHSLIPAMKLRVSAPSAVIDIGRIAGLAGIEVEKDVIRIGALTTHAAIAGSADLARHCPILPESAAQIGDLQVRNRGTIGGSLAHADPAADFPTVIAALEAELTATGPNGERHIPAERFFTDLFTTALEPAEILTRISVPVFRPGMGGAYLKHRHPASSYAVVGVAAVVALSGGTFTRVRLAVGGATEKPLVVPEAEQALSGKPASAEAIGVAAAAVARAITAPLGDLYASGEYRTHLAEVLSRRALARAAEQAERST